MKSVVFPASAAVPLPGLVLEHAALSNLVSLASDVTVLHQVSEWKIGFV